MNRDTPLIGSAEAAALFGVDRTTFNRWTKAGRVPVAMQMGGISGARLFDLSVIQDLARNYRGELDESA